jgi:hypothetical protein
VSTRITLDLELTTVHFFRPDDIETLAEYFDADSPERPLRFFLATHAKEFAQEEMVEPPQTGDSVALDGEEYVVRARSFEPPKEEGGRRHLVILVSKPLSEEAGVNPDAS